MWETLQRHLFICWIFELKMTKAIKETKSAILWSTILLSAISVSLLTVIYAFVDPIRLIPFSRYLHSLESPTAINKRLLLIAAAVALHFVIRLLSAEIFAKDKVTFPPPPPRRRPFPRGIRKQTHKTILMQHFFLCFGCGEKLIDFITTNSLYSYHVQYFILFKPSFLLCYACLT